MKEIIVLKVLCNTDGIPQSGIVRCIEIEDTQILRKYALDRKGNWILIQEGTIYPSECHLPVVQILKSTICQRCGKEGFVLLDEKAEDAMCSQCFFEGAEPVVVIADEAATTS